MSSSNPNRPDLIMQDARGLVGQRKVVPGAAYDKDTIAHQSGLAGLWPILTASDADLPAQSLQPLWLFVSDAHVDGSNPTGRAVREGLVINVDTSGASNGDPVYLSATAGGWTLTAPAVRRVIGVVVRAATAANGGAWMFDGVAHAGVIRGVATVASASSSIQVTLGGTGAADLPISLAYLTGEYDATLAQLIAEWDTTTAFTIQGSGNAADNTDIAWAIHK